MMLGWFLRKKSPSTWPGHVSPFAITHLGRAQGGEARDLHPVLIVRLDDAHRNQFFFFLAAPLVPKM